MRHFIQSDRAHTIQSATLWTLGSFLTAALAGMAFFQLSLTGLLITLSMAAVATALLPPLLRHLATPKSLRDLYPLTNTGILMICAASAVMALRPSGLTLAAASTLLLAGTAVLIAAVWRQRTEAAPAAPEASAQPTGCPNPGEMRPRRRHSALERRQRPSNAPTMP